MAAHRESGLATADPIVFEDFLPVSAAGIFQSNLGGEEQRAYAAHANREAFSACLAHAASRGVDRLVFLGDYVGYGADPGWVVDTVMEHVSRGAVVNSQALIERLRPGDVVAGLDVFDPEPIPADSEIKRLPNVFLSPHIATTASTRQAFFRLMVDEVERFLDGHQPLFEVTPRTLANRRGAPA